MNFDTLGRMLSPMKVWVTRGVLMASVLALALVSMPVFLALHEQWLQASHSDGYPVAVLAALLFASELRRGGLPLRPSAWGPAVLGGSLTATLAGLFSSVMIVPLALFPMLVLSVLLTIGGWSALWRFFPAVAFLYFAIPLWRDLEQLSVPLPALGEALRSLSTTVVSVAVRETSIPSFIEGNLIHLPRGTFEIAEGCSGRAYFLAAIELALFYGLTHLRGWRARLIVVAAAAMLSLVVNWLRVYVLILVGYVSRMQHPLMDDHGNFGWLLFLLVIGPMIVIGRRLEAAESGVRRETILPLLSSGGASMSAAMGPPAVALVMLAGAAWLGHRMDWSSGSPVVRTIELPEVRGWTLTGPWIDTRRPHFVGAAAEAAGWYRRGTVEIGVYLAGYPFQFQGSEIVNYENRLVSTAEALERRGDVTLTDATGNRLVFMELLAEEHGDARLVWYGMRVAGRTTTSRAKAKLLQAYGHLLGRTDAQVVVLSAWCRQQCATAREALSAYATEAVAIMYQVAENPGLPLSRSGEDGGAR